MLWTIQTVEAWEKAQEKGVLKADGRRVWKEFRPAYKWLIKQMCERIPNYTGDYPIWAWVQPKPDLRKAYHLSKGERGVRVEFVSFRDQALISDHSSWMSVINQDYLSLNEHEDEEFWQSAEAAKNDTERMKDLRKRIEASWERVFDIETLREHQEWHGEVDYLQAVVGQVAVEQVVKVTPFKAR